MNVAETTARDLALRTPISVFDLFTIGIGPSSSHTVGPMRAAFSFVETLGRDLAQTRAVTVELFGSLALTGKGHRTDVAVLLGLSGWQPETVDPECVEALIADIRRCGTLQLGGIRSIPFRENTNLIFRMGDFLPGHPNAVRFTATVDDGASRAELYYSVGGGFIVRDGQGPASACDDSNFRQSHPFSSGAELLEIGRRTGLPIAELMLVNEDAWRERDDTIAFLDRVRDAMMASIERSCRQDGLLPGGLKVRRRARALLENLRDRPQPDDPLGALDWVNLYALAVNEENAAGGRIVTAPTNGAAGVIPAVLKYYETFRPDASQEGSRRFLLTAAAIGTLYKRRASISAAEMGCQGEVGVACSMAAAGLAAVLGGTNEQIENAAEIGMEHNLGLTCDPIKGLVQVPCIERNTMGAVKAINAARLALHGNGEHLVSLDAVIETMRQTGNDMRSQYKETSLGGLAVNFVEC
jgi:L-serine dehydratase